MVLLRNEPDASGTATLPLAADALRRVAVIGPNAAIGQMMGGGSAHVTPTHAVHPLEAIVERLAAARCRRRARRRLHHRSEAPRARPPPVRTGRDRATSPIPTTSTTTDAKPALTTTTGTARIMWVADPLESCRRPTTSSAPGSAPRSLPTCRATWSFGVESVAPARVLVDGVVVLDNAELPSGGSFFGTGKAELTGTIVLEAGRPYALDVEIRHRRTGLGLGGVNIGARAPVTGDPMIDAVDAAAAADVSIVIVGTNDDWESEGWDRAELELPGRQDELIGRVAEVVPPHGGRGQRRIARGDAVARVGRVGAHGMVPGPGDGRVVGRCAVRRRRAAGPPARHVPPPARGHPGVRAPPGPQRRRRVPRAPPRRVPLVRHRRAASRCSRSATGSGMPT